MINETLNGIFERYGPLAKEIKEKISEQLNVSLQEFSMVDYNSFIAKAITETLEKQINTECVEPIQELISRLVSPLENREYTISEIYEAYREFLMEDACSDDDDGEFSFHVLRGDSYITVAMDEKPDVEPRSCEIEFLISKNRDKIFLYKTKTHWGHKNEVDPISITQLNRFKLFLFRLYSSKTKINVDETSFENTWSRHEY